MFFLLAYPIGLFFCGNGQIKGRQANEGIFVFGFTIIIIPIFSSIFFLILALN